MGIRTQRQFFLAKTLHHFRFLVINFLPCKVQSVFTHVASIYANLLEQKKMFA